MNEKERLVVYVAMNNRTTHMNELPETAAALKKADEQGLGKKKLIPVADRLGDGSSTYASAFGRAPAGQMTWWEDDKSKALRKGQLRAGDRTLTLGSNDRNPALETKLSIVDDWRQAMMFVGLTAQKAEEVVNALMIDHEGHVHLTDSKPGASNELLQLISIFNRAEQGEFEIDSLVLSGHHLRGSRDIFGEARSGEWDLEDALSIVDISNLRKAFPRAFAQVRSVQFSACNTQQMGTDRSMLAPAEVERTQDNYQYSTGDWALQVFPNVQAVAYWDGKSHAAERAAEASGEFQLDVARKESGDSTAFADAAHIDGPHGGRLVREERQTKKNYWGRSQEVMDPVAVTHNAESYETRLRSSKSLRKDRAIAGYLK